MYFECQCAVPAGTKPLEAASTGSADQPLELLAQSDTTKLRKPYGQQHHKAPLSAKPTLA